MAYKQHTRRGSQLIAEAVTWLSEGVSVVPALPRSKAVNIRWRQYESVPPTIETIKRWFSAGTSNLAVICGTGGLQVLDFDDRQRYETWKLAAGSFADSYTEYTWRGVHVFFKVQDPETRRFVECEALGLGHLCHVAPSIHPVGKIYYSPDPIAPIRWATKAELFSLLSEQLKGEKTELKGEKLSKGLPGRTVRNGGAGQQLDLLTRLKTSISLVDYASNLTQLKPSGGDGRWFIGRCPFHDDQEPSFWVDGQRDLWRCYSPSCKGSRGGDVINLFALVNGIETGEAIKQLAKETL